jgi:hypothetical protein
VILSLSSSKNPEVNFLKRLTFGSAKRSDDGRNANNSDEGGMKEGHRKKEPNK